MNIMIKCLAAGALLLSGGCLQTNKTAKRECWCWYINNLKTEADYAQTTNLLTRCAASGYNALVLNVNEIGYWNPAIVARLKKVNALAQSLDVEIIPSIWSLGYAGTVCYVEPDTVETTPMKNLRYRAQKGRMQFMPSKIKTGYEGQVATNQIQMMLTDELRPYHTYRFSCRVKTKDIAPNKYHAVRGNIYHASGKDYYSKGKAWELYDFIVKPTQDWKEYSWEFNTYETSEIVLRVGINRGLKVAGDCWFDSIKVEELPLARCLTKDAAMRPVVRSAKTGKVYAAGKDYKPFPVMKRFAESKPMVLELLPGGAIAEGEELLVDAHVPAIQGAKQFSACPSADGVKAYFRKCAKDINEALHPRRWFFSVDEWRIANRCERCRARGVSPGQLIGECIAEMAKAVRELNPNAEVCAWADMICPLENAGRNPYYCVDGSLMDSWKYVPKDLIMVPWMNGRSDIKTTNWLMEHGFRCIAGGYYNYPDFSRDIKWRDACKHNPKFLGMMFTSWGGTWADGGYYDLEAYARMVHELPEK